MPSVLSSPPHGRLLSAVTHTLGRDVGATPDLESVSLAEPAAVSEALGRYLPGRFVVSGTIERRLLLAERPNSPTWTVAELSGAPLGEREWPAWTEGRLRVDQPDAAISTTAVGDDVYHRLSRPRVLLVALYHPEHFPLPRFPLAISDVARAARLTLLGQVRLIDMQLGASVDDIAEVTREWQPDIVGISATFGQHDLMLTVLDHLTAMPARPMIIAGGSLTARNERVLLDRYLALLIARGAGEATIQDLLSHWHGDLDLRDVRGLGYHGAARGGTLTVGRFRHNASLGNRFQSDIFPELDLLDATFRHNGVAQLETSRGCTNYCSFCPRGHKGVWSGTAPTQLPWILAAMREIFDRHPRVSRTVYLVDEEFIGRDHDAAERALAIATTVHDAGFRWETSCRIDQVVWPDRDEEWHTDRVQMWRDLLDRGLRRCLFGVESGVTSILQRFNKETTAEQNALAIRTLSALGVPTRYTYITFDHLMTLDELQQTHAFQARRDLILRPLPHLSPAEIVRGVRDEVFVAEHTTGEPFYRGISYMLVSMECLIGAAYTRLAAAAGLTGEVRPAMGRVDAEFADWRIGVCSHHAQLWVDRNFALDYTLKSLEKILDGEPRHAVRRARVVLKTAAFTLLSDMLGLISHRAPNTRDLDGLGSALRSVMNNRIEELRGQMAATTADVVPVLPGEARRLLEREHERWATTGSWRLINAAEACAA